MTKRDVFGELMEGVAAMKTHLEGKLTLRSFNVEPAPLPKVDAKLIRGTRQKLGCSRAVFARQLRINLRSGGPTFSPDPETVVGPPGDHNNNRQLFLLTRKSEGCTVNM